MQQSGDNARNDDFSNNIDICPIHYTFDVRGMLYLTTKQKGVMFSFTPISPFPLSLFLPNCRSG